MNMMNKTSRVILEEILAHESSWDPKTRELKYNEVISDLASARESWFEYGVLWPKMARFYHLLRLLSTNIPEDAWEEVEWEGVGDGWVVNDDEIGYEVSTRVDGMCNKIWHNEDWAYEEPSKEELLAMNIKPNYVPAKVFKRGAVQPSMF